MRLLREEADFFSASWEDAAARPDDEWRASAMEAEMGTTRTVFIAAEGDSWLGVVGCYLHDQPGSARLVSMWVDPVARRRGIAQALVTAVAQWAAERGCDQVSLVVHERNEPAWRLYERAGFRETGQQEELPHGRGFKRLYSAAVVDLVR